MATTEANVAEYQDQYDPNNDFAIFGVGDPTMGGLQSMKEKMNMADAKQDSSDEETDNTHAHKMTGS